MVSDPAKMALSGDVPLRFVQVTAAPEGTAADGIVPVLYGLTADGRVYQLMGGRERLKEPVERVGHTGLKYKDHYGPFFSWWQPIRMSEEKGAEYEPPATPKEFL